MAAPAQAEARSALTDASGWYRVIELPPGVYNISFTLAGFTTVRREGVVLTPNFAASINAELRVGDITETITFVRRVV